MTVIRKWNDHNKEEKLKYSIYKAMTYAHSGWDKNLLDTCISSFSRHLQLCD